MIVTQQKELNGKRRWFVQLINEGEPFKKPQNYVTPGIIWLDLNISNVAFVADKKAGLLPFAEGVPTFPAEITRLQSKMERSRRASNPDGYEPDFKANRGNRIVTNKGKAIKGKRQRFRSKTYLKTGERIKKSLSERVHKDRSGKVMHRDLFSAYLSRHVNQDMLSLQDARE